MEKTKAFTLDELHEIDIDLGLKKTEIYSLYQDGLIVGDDAVRQLLELNDKICDILKNPSYTSEYDYFEALWAKVYDDAEDTYTKEMGYVYRRRLDILKDTIDVDIILIGLDCGLDITVY